MVILIWLVVLGGLLFELLDERELLIVFSGVLLLVLYLRVVL